MQLILIRTLNLKNLKRKTYQARIYRINCDCFRVPSKGIKGRAPSGNVMDFFIPRVPFLEFLSNSEISDRFP